MTERVAMRAYRPDIDGLRAFAVIFVVIFHAFPEALRGGFVGVDVFFVISGFLIGGIILRDLRDEKFSFLHFYERRILRIFPALALVLGVTLLAGYFLLFNDEYEMLGKHVFGGAAFISNLLYYFEAGYWDISGKYKPLLHLWSLGIEEQFYIVIPIVLAAAWKRKCRLSIVAASLLIASFACNIYYYRSHQELDFYMPFTRFWEIFIGVMLAALVEYGHPASNWPRARNILSILGLICLVVAVLASRERHFPGHRALWPTLGTALIISAGSQAWLNRALFSNKLAVGIGLISYPLYLWHWPLLSFAAILNGDVVPSRQWLYIRVVCVPLSAVLALLTYILVERPLRFGKSGRKIKVYALIAAMLCVGAAGARVALFGAPERSFMKPYQTAMEKMGVLSHPVWNDGSIAQYAPEAGDLRFARYRDAGGSQTVAVIGDSHSPPIFHGIAENAHGLNSVLMVYRPDASQAQHERDLVLAVIREKKDISDVFIVMRGILYLTGTDTDRGAGQVDDYDFYFMGDKFKPWLQTLVDALRNAGKRVYIVSENPVFPYPSRAIVRRPFVNLGPEPSALSMSREDVYRHQKEYLDILHGIQGAEIINGMEAFFRDDSCSMLSEDGISLYVDHNHLTASGGKYLVDAVLEPYIRAIAERGANPPNSPIPPNTSPAVP